MDIEWKSYDYRFVAELDLPYLLVNSMKGTWSLLLIVVIFTNNSSLSYLFF